MNYQELFQELTDEELIKKAHKIANKLTSYNAKTRLPADFWDVHAEFDKLIHEYNKRGMKFDREGYLL